MRSPTLLALSAALVLVLQTPMALASHMGQYAFNPVEHDDQGRSDEPDGASTSLLGALVTNAVIDLDQDGWADVPTPIGTGNSVLAPGCTGLDGLRRVSGSCGLWTVGAGAGAVGTVVPPRTADVPGVTVSTNCATMQAPGRYGDSALRFLDHQAQLALLLAGPANWVDANHKLADLDQTTGGALTALAGPAATRTIAGPTAEWAWYGVWQDLNCNGVIDHLQEEGAPPAARIDNEFQWLGACRDFEGAFRPDLVAAGLCAEDPNPNSNPPGFAGGDARTTMVAWVFPGNHHGFLVPDIPGNQVLDALVFADPEPDETAANFAGDPLLDQQLDTHWDLVGSDRTGEPDGTGRQWVLGNGFGVWYYDQSLLATTLTVTGVNCKSNPLVRAGFDVGASGPGGACTFVDVDRYPTASPAAEQLLTGLKANGRASWETVLASRGPLQRAGDVADHVVYDATLAPQRGLVDDLAMDPGWSREPNHASDLFPGVRHGTCATHPGVAGAEATHRGWCNTDVSGTGTVYGLYGAEPRGWLDVQPVRSLAYLMPLYGLPPPAQCLQCIAGPGAGLGFAGEPQAGESVPSADDHTRTLGPGEYYFSGVMGRWKDTSHAWDESVIGLTPPAPPGGCQVGDPAPCQTYGPDGWVGRASEGFERYRGFDDEACTTELGAGVKPWAQCHPYSDGNSDDPQDYGLGHKEWAGACQLGPGNQLLLKPAGGVWNAPLIVWREVEQGAGPLGPLPQLQVIAAGTPVVAINLSCRVASTGAFLSRDHVILPQGNRATTILTELAVDVPVTVGGVPSLDSVTDVDRYAPALL